MSLSTHELEDIAAARLVRSNLEVSTNPSENLLTAVAAGLLLNEITNAEQERKHIEQSMMIGQKVTELVGAVA